MAANCYTKLTTSVHCRYSLRPAARRLLLSSSSVPLFAKQRSIASVTPSALRWTRPSPRFAIQRRWKSDAVQKEPAPEKTEKEVSQEKTEEEPIQGKAEEESTQVKTEDTPTSEDQSNSRAAESAAEAATEQSSPTAVDEVTKSTETATEQASPANERETAEKAEVAAASDVQPTSESGAQTDGAQGNDTRRRRFWSPPSPKETVYVGNLFFDVTAEDLKRQMSKYGVVESAKIIHDSRGLSKG